MKHALATVAIFLLSIILPTAAQSAPPATTSTTPPDALMPKLSGPLSLDGRLDEWQSVLSVPVRDKACLTINNKRLQWQGPDDASASVRIAWNDEGLCIAADIRDNDVFNDREPEFLFLQDGLEIFLDVRNSRTVGTKPISAGWYQFFIRPPMGDKGPEFHSINGKIRTEDIRLASTSSAGGYVLEILIPWSALELAPKGKSEKPALGRRVGASFQLNDYDRRDKDVNQPRVLSCDGTRRLHESPQWLIKYELAETVLLGPGLPLGPSVSIGCKTIITDTRVLEIDVDANDPIRGRASSIHWSVVGSSGNKLAEETVQTASGPAAMAKVRFDPAQHEGPCTLLLSLRDVKGQEIGTTRKNVILAGKSLESMLGRIEKAFQAARVLESPFKAAAVMAACTDYERYKRRLELGDPEQMVIAAKHLNLRLDVLEKGPQDLKEENLLSLLNLAANPDAQVIVEYAELRESGSNLSQADGGFVLFKWGSIPITTVFVEGNRTKRDYTFVLRGKQLVGCAHPCKELAERAIEMVVARKPITPEQVNELRQISVKWAKEKGLYKPESAITSGPTDGMRLFCGDVHMHTFFTDGMSSPVGITLLAMYCGMDYNVITDHTTSLGAQVAKVLFDRYKLAGPMVIGNEHGNSSVHVGVYPVKESLPNLADMRQRVKHLPPAEQDDAYFAELVKLAHAQGAVTTYNHPGKPNSSYHTKHMPLGLQSTPFDAWEHMPPAEYYQKWKKEGTLPVITGGSDTHSGCFGGSGRTIILAPSPSGDDLAQAVRDKRVAIWAGSSSEVYVGSPLVVARLWEALDEGESLRQLRMLQLKKAFEAVDLIGLLKASPPRRVNIAEVLDEQPAKNN